jgi:hypothetical protein
VSISAETLLLSTLSLSFAPTSPIFKQEPAFHPCGISLVQNQLLRGKTEAALFISVLAL